MNSTKQRFGAQPRMACTMWEFSWLTRRAGKRDEYKDWDRVLDELVERGYNCIRLDVFPHLVAADLEGKHQEQFTILPDRNVIQWGNDIPVEVNPREGLITFMQKAKQRGIRFGLSTWLNPDKQNRRSMLRTPEDYVRVWSETLAFIDEHGLLDVVEWVDLTNEWPLGVWGGYYYPAIFNKRRARTSAGLMLPIVMPWSDQILENMANFMRSAIEPLRQRWPALRFTFSFVGILSQRFARVDLSSLDLLEPHIWLSDSMKFSNRTGAGLATLQLPLGLSILHRRGASVYEGDRKRWQTELGTLMDNWVTIARERDLPLYTSESWACTVYDDRSADGLSGEWDWLKDLNQAGVEMAVDRGWTGICSSNFCQPHFKGMWADIEWHRQVTNTILG